MVARFCVVKQSPLQSTTWLDVEWRGFVRPSFLPFEAYQCQS